MHEVSNINLTKPIPKIEQKLHWFWKILKISKIPKVMSQNVKFMMKRGIKDFTSEEKQD